MKESRIKSQVKALRNAFEVLFMNHRAFYNDTVAVTIHLEEFIKKRQHAMWVFRVRGYDFNFEVLAIVKEVEKMLVDTRVVEVRALSNGNILLLVMRLGSRLTYHINVEKVS